MHKSFAAVLASGSSGNSILVKFRDAGLLVDVGLSCREAENRLSRFGVDPSEICGVLLTHEHTDHSRGVRKFCLKHGVPVFTTAGTLSIVRLAGVKTRIFVPGQSFRTEIGTVRSFPVNHFASDPVAFSISSQGKRVSVASDLGSVTSQVIAGLANTNLLFLEANYDDEMLMSGGYPEFLKRTIRGPKGHLSNDDAGILCTLSVTDATASVVLVHLSKENNTPEKARTAVEDKLRAGSTKARLEVTEHGALGGPFCL